jgi:hypothetical protein
MFIVSIAYDKSGTMRSKIEFGSYRIEIPIFHYFRNYSPIRKEILLPIRPI